MAASEPAPGEVARCSERSSSRPIRPTCEPLPVSFAASRLGYPRDLLGRRRLARPPAMNVFGSRLPSLSSKLVALVEARSSERRESFSGPLVRGAYAGEPTMAPLKMTLTQSLSVAT